MRPEHVFTDKLEDWDRNVFLGAAYFTVVVRRLGKWDNIPTFPEALDIAKQHPKASLIYAVAASGRSACMVPKRWEEFLSLWHDVKFKEDGGFTPPGT